MIPLLYQGSRLGEIPRVFHGDLVTQPGACLREREPFDRVLARARRHVHAEARGVRLETHLADLVVPGDPIRLRQVVVNLLSNALKFTPPGGLVRVELAGRGEVAVIEVADSGPGIDPDELPRIFDRFFRGRGVRAGGSGIGLSVVRELVGAHGGEVDVASERGRGAIFTVRLPAAASVPRRSFTASS